MAESYNYLLHFPDNIRPIGEPFTGMVSSVEGQREFKVITVYRPECGYVSLNQDVDMGNRNANMFGLLNTDTAQRLWAVSNHIDALITSCQPGHCVEYQRVEVNKQGSMPYETIVLLSNLSNRQMLSQMRTEYCSELYGRNCYDYLSDSFDRSSVQVSGTFYCVVTFVCDRYIDVCTEENKYVRLYTQNMFDLLKYQDVSKEVSDHVHGLVAGCQPGHCVICRNVTWKNKNKEEHKFFALSVDMTVEQKALQACRKCEQFMQTL